MRRAAKGIGRRLNETIEGLKARPSHAPILPCFHVLIMLTSFVYLNGLSALPEPLHYHV